MIEPRYRDGRIHPLLAHQTRAAAIEAAAKAKIEAERRERERVEKLERERVERLLVDAEQLRQAHAIRAHIEEASQRYASLADGTRAHYSLNGAFWHLRRLTG